MILDCHVHVASREVLPDFFFDGWAENLERRYPRRERALRRPAIDGLLRRITDDPSCARLVAEMDDAGIDQAVLLAIDFGEPFVPPHALHREVAASHPKRFLWMAGFHPQRGREGVEELERALRDGARGVKLYPPCGFSPADPALAGCYELCAAHGVPVITHVGPSTPRLASHYAAPAEVERAAHAFPRVDFILAHAAFTLHEEAALLAEYRPNVYLETSGFQNATGRGELEGVLASHRRRGLARKLVFGTDWPIHRLSGGQRPAVTAFRDAAATAGFDEAEIAAIMGETAAELLSGDGR